MRTYTHAVSTAHSEYNIFVCSIQKKKKPG